MTGQLIRAVKDLGRQTKGGSGSHFFDCDDGKQYVVKFVDGSKTVVNEFVGYELSRALQVPVYDHALVEVDENLVRQSPDLTQRGIRAGLQHGTEYHPEALDLEGRQLEGLRIQNAESIPAIITLDNWIFNTDRNNGGNILLEADAVGGHRVIATDFNSALSGTWSAESLSVTASNRNMVDTHPLFMTVISGQNPFSQTFRDLEQIQYSYLQTVVDTLPSTWPISVDERLALLDCLDRRKLVVPQTIQANKARFPRWSP